MADGELTLLELDASTEPEHAHIDQPDIRARCYCLDTETLLDRMEQYRADVVAFAEECLVTTRPDGVGLEPLRLERHQKAWLRESTRRDRDGHFRYKVVVASWPKREGKSMLVSVLLAWRMCCFADQDSVVLANSERQAASNIFDELVDFFRNSPALKAYVSEDDIQRRQLNVWRLGNTTTCVPCNFRTVQGMAVTGILAVDELHAVQDMRAYNYLRAQTEATDSQTAVSSQAGPSVNSNPVWRLYEQREQPHIHFDYKIEHICSWAKRLAEQQKAELTPAEYAALHQNAWGGLGQKLFAQELLAKARMDYALPETREKWDALREAWGFCAAPYVIAIGLDRAGVSARGDRTVWTVIARFDVPDELPVYRVVRCQILPTGAEAEVLAEWEQTQAIFGAADGIVFEQYQCADLVDKVDKARLETPTTQRQQSLFGNLYRLFKECRIGYCSKAGVDPHTHAPGVLNEELVAFEHEVITEGRVRFGTQSGVHDDTVYSLAWAVEATQGVWASTADMWL